TGTRDIGHSPTATGGCSHRPDYVSRLDDREVTMQPWIDVSTAAVAIARYWGGDENLRRYMLDRASARSTKTLELPKSKVWFVPEPALDSCASKRYAAARYPSVRSAN